MQHYSNSLAGSSVSLALSMMGDRMRVAAEMLIAGVAFQTSGKKWEVFSHEGEYLGELSTFIVSTVIGSLKKLGLKHTHVTTVARGVRDSVTFGHYYPYQDELAEIMRRRSKKPSVIH